MSTDREQVQLVLLGQQRDAQAMVRRGVILAAIIPIAIAGGVVTAKFLDTFVPLIVVALYVVLGGCLAGLWVVAGVLKDQRLQRELRALEDSRLPRARLLK